MRTAARNLQLATIVLLGLAACTVTPVLEMTIKRPVGNQAATELGRLAVVPLAGDEAQSLSQDLKAALGDVRLKKRPVFQIVDASELVALSRSHASRDSSAARSAVLAAATAMGLDGVYLSTTQPATFVANEYIKNVQVCVKPDGLLDCDGYQTVQVRCAEWKIRLEADVDLVRVENGELVSSFSASRQVDRDFCENEADIPDRESMLAKARRGIVKEIVSEVTPSIHKSKIRLKARAPALPPAEREVFEGGVEFAASGRLDRACAAWEGLSERVESVPVLFNLAACAEADGDYTRALGLLTRADSALTRPDEDVSKGLRRNRKRLDEQRAAD
ncbi:MAG: hypothetical protein R3F16_05870 [Myxococcota bacterium]|nr:hypothetical protein [Myxococcales bacterium]